MLPNRYEPVVECYEGFVSPVDGTSDDLVVAQTNGGRQSTRTSYVSLPTVNNCVTKMPKSNKLWYFIDLNRKYSILFV